MLFFFNKPRLRVAYTIDLGLGGITNPTPFYFLGFEIPILRSSILSCCPLKKNPKFFPIQ
jgi:hypothetical protein